MKKRKFVWNISQKENFIVVELNGSITSMIDTTYTDALENNKQSILNEINFWSAIHKTTVYGKEILN